MYGENNIGWRRWKQAIEIQIKPQVESKRTWWVAKLALVHKITEGAHSHSHIEKTLEEMRYVTLWI